MKALNKNQNKSPFCGKINRSLLVISMILIVALMSCSKDDDPILPTTGVQVSTIAGSTPGFANGTGANAQFSSPLGVAVDSKGNVYVADFDNHKIRKIAPNGEVSTFAGSTPGFADGAGTSAKFSEPTAIAIDNQDVLYVCDFNNTIRKITPDGVVSILAGNPNLCDFVDGSGTNASFCAPTGIAVDAQGNVYVVSEFEIIRKITPDGTVSTLKDSNGDIYEVDTYTGIAIDSFGKIYISSDDSILKITINGDEVIEVITVAGSDDEGFLNGTGVNAQFNSPQGLAIDGQDNIYVADEDNHKIRKITQNGEVSTLAGSTIGFADGTGANAQFNFPYAVAVDSKGNLYVADIGNDRIRKIIQE